MPSRVAARALLGTWGLLLLVVLAFVPRVLVAWELPLLATAPDHPECAPDEGLQYWTVMRYADGDFSSWPTSGSIYSAYPPTAYALHAVTLALARVVPGAATTERFPSSWWRLRRYAAARLGSVILGVLTVLLAACAAGAWTGSRLVAIASGAAIALYPQLVFVNGYVNADAFTIATGAGLWLAVSQWASGGEGRAGMALVGAAAGLVVLGKPSGYATLVPTALWVLDARRRGRLVWADLVRTAGATMLVTFPVLAANAFRNQGDPLGLAKYRELLATSYHGHTIHGTFVPFLGALARSSFGVFRNADLPLPGFFYLCAIAFLGVAVGSAVTRRRRFREVGLRAAAWLAVALIGSLALVVWNAMVVDAQAQGRYLLPVLVPVGSAATCMLGTLRGLGPALVALWLAFLASATIAGIVLIHAHPCV
jgi:Dolichyl-phosphate-mannose-protein mannosyltransferase